MDLSSLAIGIMVPTIFLVGILTMRMISPDRRNTRH